MSDIAKARTILETLLRWEGLSAFARTEIARALPLLDRAKPDFVAKPTRKALTPEQEAQCRDLRAQGEPLYRIAHKLGTDIGRVSEAINGK